MGNPTTSLQNVTAPRSVPRSTRRKPTAKRPSGLQLLLYFARRHPFISLFTVWLAFLFFGWLAIKGLIYTNPAPLEVVEPPVAEAPAHSTDSGNAIGLLTIVIVTCATSSIWLSRRLRPVHPPSRRVIRRQPASRPTSKRTTNPTEPFPRVRQPSPATAPARSNAIPKTTTHPAIAPPVNTGKPIAPPLNLAEKLAIRQPKRESKQSSSNQ